MLPPQDIVRSALVNKNSVQQKRTAPYDIDTLPTDFKKLKMGGAWSSHPPDQLNNGVMDTDDLTSIDNNKLDATQLTTNDNINTPKLLEYPPEIRERIFGFAVSLPNRISTKSRHCTSHPLANVNRQLRKEVTPIFFGTNTFHFTAISPNISRWVPLAQPDRLLHLALDLETSINSFGILKGYGWQPIRVLHEDEFLSDEEKETDEAVVLGATVVWKPMSRIIEEMGMRPKNGRILGKRHLDDVVEERKVAAEERKARIMEAADDDEMEVDGDEDS